MVALDNLFEDVPHLGTLPLHQFFCTFDGLNVPLFLQLLNDEGLK